MLETDLIEFLGKMADALLIERKEEEHRFTELISQKSIAERRKLGSCWHPVDVVESGFAAGGNPYLVFERNASETSWHEFYQGTPVELFTEDSDERVRGVVKSAERQKLKVILNGDDLPSQYQYLKWGIDLRYDDKTFDEMALALNEIINVEKGRLKELRNVLYGAHDASFGRSSEITLPKLNASQNQALNAAINADDFAVIHGPPGTGKTTTIISIVEQLVKRSGKIMVCAPSNTAVDLIAGKLFKAGVNVLRLGNITRIDEENLAITLDSKLKENPQYKLVKELRKRSIDTRAKAGKFKRNFDQNQRNERRELYAEARDLSKEARQTEDFLVQSVIEKADVICTTLIGSAGRSLTDITFDTVIIDEAGQASDPALWVPIKKGNKVILAGDPMQLPPTVKSEKAQRMQLDKTLIERAVKEERCTSLLDTQYRMHEKIMGYSNDKFYEGKLKAFEANAQHLLWPGDLPLEFVDTAGCGFEEKADGEEGSKYNPEEADILEKHFNSLKEQYTPFEIGVISPYRAQVELLKESFAEHKNVIVQTIDGFQGQEKDVIYISLVRSNSESTIGFLKDYRRMNVAVTRAKKKLVVIGNSETIAQDKFYSGFIDYCEQNDSYKSAWEFMM